MTCLPRVLRRPAAHLLQSSHERPGSRHNSSGMRPRLASKLLPYRHPRHGLRGPDSADDCIQAWGQPAAHLLEHPTQVSHRGVTALVHLGSQRIACLTNPAEPCCTAAPC